MDLALAEPPAPSPLIGLLVLSPFGILTVGCVGVSEWAQFRFCVCMCVIEIVPLVYSSVGLSCNYSNPDSQGPVVGAGTRVARCLGQLFSILLLTPGRPERRVVHHGDARPFCPSASCQKGTCEQRPQKQTSGCRRATVVLSF